MKRSSVVDDLRSRASVRRTQTRSRSASAAGACCSLPAATCQRAIGALEAALAEHARRPLAPEVARTLLELGTLQRRAKQKNAAKQTLERALSMFEPMGAQMWVDRARDELSRIGLRRPTVSDGLTPAQTRVAELVVDGLSNREIASTLYMSPRSVEAHLTKIYREYGVRSRAQLVAALSAAPGSASNGSAAPAVSPAERTRGMIPRVRQRLRSAPRWFSAGRSSLRGTCDGDAAVATGGGTPVPRTAIPVAVPIPMIQSAEPAEWG